MNKVKSLSCKKITIKKTMFMAKFPLPATQAELRVENIQAPRKLRRMFTYFEFTRRSNCICHSLDRIILSNQIKKHIFLQMPRYYKVTKFFLKILSYKIKDNRSNLMVLHLLPEAPRCQTAHKRQIMLYHKIEEKVIISILYVPGFLENL